MSIRIIHLNPEKVQNEEKPERDCLYFSMPTQAFDCYTAYPFLEDYLKPLEKRQWLKYPHFLYRWADRSEYYRFKTITVCFERSRRSRVGAIERVESRWVSCEEADDEFSVSWGREAMDKEECERIYRERVAALLSRIQWFDINIPTEELLTSRLACLRELGTERAVKEKP